MAEILQIITGLISVVALAAAGLFCGRILYDRTNMGLRKANTDELTLLNETRAERISELEVKVTDLEEQVVALRAAVEAWQALRAEEIATRVAELLAPMLRTS